MSNSRKLILTVALGALIVGAVWSTSLAGCNEEDRTMGITNDEPVPNGRIPALDAAAPTRTETATFALG